MIETEIFEVDGESRILVDTITTNVEEHGDQLEIVQSDTDTDHFKDLNLENFDSILDSNMGGNVLNIRILEKHMGKNEL